MHSENAAATQTERDMEEGRQEVYQRESRERGRREQQASFLSLSQSESALIEAKNERE